MNRAVVFMLVAGALTSLAACSMRPVPNFNRSAQLDVNTDIPLAVGNLASPSADRKIAQQERNRRCRMVIRLESPDRDGTLNAVYADGTVQSVVKNSPEDQIIFQTAFITNRAVCEVAPLDNQQGYFYVAR